MGTEEPRGNSSHQDGLTTTEVVELYLHGPIGLTSLQTNEVSAYVPNFQMFESIIHHTDVALSASRYFTNETDNIYHSVYTKYYYALLFTKVVIAQMRKYGTSTASQNEFLDLLDSAFPDDQLPVDGLIAPLFVALAPAETDDKECGNVIPYIPSLNTMVLNEENSQCYPVPLLGRLPYVPGLRRAINRLHQAPLNDPAHTRADMDLHSSVALDAGIAVVNDTIHAAEPGRKYRRTMPGFLYPASPINLLNHRSSNRTPTVPNALIEDEIFNEIELFGLQSGTHFLTRFIALESIRCSYVMSSTVLSQLRHDSGGIGHLDLTHAKLPAQIQPIIDWAETGILAIDAEIADPLIPGQFVANPLRPANLAARNLIVYNRCVARTIAQQPATRPVCISNSYYCVSRDTVPNEATAKLALASQLTAPTNLEVFSELYDQNAHPGIDPQGPWSAKPNRWTSNSFTPSLRLATACGSSQAITMKRRR
jgi:hypothetical protein